METHTLSKRKMWKTKHNISSKTLKTNQGKQDESAFSSRKDESQFCLWSTAVIWSHDQNTEAWAVVLLTAKSSRHRMCTSLQVVNISMSEQKERAPEECSVRPLSWRHRPPSKRLKRLRSGARFVHVAFISGTLAYHLSKTTRSTTAKRNNI